MRRISVCLPSAIRSFEAEKEKLMRLDCQSAIADVSVRHVEILEAEEN